MILFFIDHRYLGDSLNPATKWVALLLGPLMVGRPRAAFLMVTEIGSVVESDCLEVSR